MLGCLYAVTKKYLFVLLSINCTVNVRALQNSIIMDLCRPLCIYICKLLFSIADNWYVDSSFTNYVYIFIPVMWWLHNADKKMVSNPFHIVLFKPREIIVVFFPELYSFPVKIWEPSTASQMKFQRRLKCLSLVRSKLKNV